MKPIQEENQQNQNSGFKVPENYFEELENNVMQKINTSQKSFYLGRKVWAVAASILVIMGISTIFIVLNNTNSEKAKLYSSNKDSSIKVGRVAPVETANLEKAGTEFANSSEENIDNTIFELAEELNMSDEELIEIMDILEI